MKIPITKYGLPQAAMFPVGLIVVMVLLWIFKHPTTPMWVVHYGEIALGLVTLWSISFFRDPEREVPQDKNLLLAPADGMITDIETVDENEFIKGKALKVGIFLSIFDVHINRSPCRTKVEKITYRHGEYLDARNPESSKVNESNALWLVRLESPNDRLIVRQISGAIARRIVCKTQAGKELLAGERFGMIKFGSRTELYVPAQESVKCLVQKGDKVKAGITPIFKYV